MLVSLRLLSLPQLLCMTQILFSLHCQSTVCSVFAVTASSLMIQPRKKVYCRQNSGRRVWVKTPIHGWKQGVLFSAVGSSAQTYMTETYG
jgi:hypothetical protein